MKNAEKISACYDAESAELFADLSDVPKAFVNAHVMAGIEDAQETLAFARQLETIKNRVYATKYPELKGRRFVPTSNEAGAATEYLTYRIWDDYVMAKVIGNYSTDIPTVNASAREVSVKLYTVGDAYIYSIDDLRMAQRAGTGLVDKLAKASRRGIELLRDEHTAFGTPEMGSFGLLNHPNVAIESLANGDWANPATTGEEILQDLNQLVTSMMVTTNEIFMGDTLLMSIEAFRIVSTKLLDAGNSSNITVLQAFRAQNPGITVDSWTKLANANAAGNAGRIVFYKNDSEVLEFEVGIEFEQMPVEYRAMTYTTVCRARWGGVQIQYPNAILYSDNAGV
jgi:hypothetical protein